MCRSRSAAAAGSELYAVLLIRSCKLRISKNTVYMKLCSDGALRTL